MYKIYTLGDFDIKYNNKSILDGRGYSYKLIKLLKYFLTYEGKKILPEKIIEDLWEDSDFKNPHNVLRTQISRLRRIIDFDKLNIKPFFKIEYINGYYLFKLEDDCELDFKKFDLLTNQGSSLLNMEKEKGLSTFKYAITLYKGKYLQELEDERWIIPIRNRYDRLYLKILSNYLRILKNKGMYHDIIVLCEEAIEYKPYEEILHIYFLEALMEIGQQRYALNHYEFYTSKFYKDLGLAPSEKAKEIYKKLQSKDEKPDSIIDLNIIGSILKDDNTEGALVCDFHYFKFLYNFELRNMERNKDRKVYLGIITIDNIGYRPLHKNKIKECMEILKNIISNKLRKGDVLSKWNDSQLVVLIYDIEPKDINKINKRLREEFETRVLDKNIILNIKYKKI